MTQVSLYFTPRKAAEFLTEAGLSVTEDTVRRWAREDQITSIMMPGRQRRIPRAALERILSGEHAAERVA